MYSLGMEIVGISSIKGLHCPKLELEVGEVEIRLSTFGTSLLWSNAYGPIANCPP